MKYTPQLKYHQQNNQPVKQSTKMKEIEIRATQCDISLHNAT